MVDRHTIGFPRRSRQSRRQSSYAFRFGTSFGTYLDRLFRRILIRFIGFYQRQLSPHKGFSCAYRVLHGTHSCSQGTQEILRDYSLGEALPRIRQQFRQCREAAHIIRDRRSQIAQHYPRCRRRRLHFATPNDLLFPSLGDRVLMHQTVSQESGEEGYGQSRRESKRRNANGSGDFYKARCCDFYDCASCGVGTYLEEADCCDFLEIGDGCINGCDGGDGCVGACS